jgi:hypothetical protein
MMNATTITLSQPIHRRLTAHAPKLQRLNNLKNASVALQASRHKSPQAGPSGTQKHER